MWSHEIVDRLKGFPEFIGVFSREELPTSLPRKLPVGLIVNTAYRQSPGEHWVAIFIDVDGVGEYMDPFGIPPLLPEFINFLKNMCGIRYFSSKRQLQCLECITCGEYSTCYLIARFKKIWFAEFMAMFTRDPYHNDILIKQYFYTM